MFSWNQSSFIGEIRPEPDAVFGDLEKMEDSALVENRVGRPLRLPCAVCWMECVAWIR